MMAMIMSLLPLALAALLLNPASVYCISPLLARILQAGGKPRVNDLLPHADLTNSDDAQTLLGYWATEHQKTFESPEDEAQCLLTFQQRAARIQDVNAANRGYTLALNSMACTSPDDLVSTRLGALPQTKSTSGSAGGSIQKREAAKNRKKRFLFGPATTTTKKPTTTTLPPTTTKTPPTSVNWTALGVVTPARDQGSCSSCWAFSSAEAMESCYAILHGSANLTVFSVQQIVDCAGLGCGDGEPTNGYALAGADNGMVPDALYPYTSGVNGTSGSCMEANFKRVSIQVNYTNIPQSDAALLNAVGNFGPVAATINVSTTAVYDFFYYSSGIMNASDPNFCGPSTNHAVLVVGYGANATTGETYWIIKNSWGTGWGQNGFGLISRTTPDACGLTEGATSIKCK